MKKAIHIVFFLINLIGFLMQAYGQKPNLPVACGGSRVRYGVKGLPNSVFNWDIQDNGGKIIANNNDSVDVVWSNVPGIKILTVTEYSQFNCNAAPYIGYVLVSNPSLKLDSNLIVCEGQKVDIDPHSSFTSYIWSNGDTTKIISVSSKGLYKLVAKDNNGCSVSDSVSVTVVPGPKVNLGRDTSVCDYLVLDAGNDGVRYHWNTDAITQTIKITDGKEIYWVEVENDKGCKATDTIHISYCQGTKKNLVPNAFTPNGDGDNDTWRITSLAEYPLATVEVYDRWGRMVYQAKHGFPTDGWDGVSNGKPLPMDSYFYIINKNNGENPMTGTVTIIR